jgi:low temperature requirement protein LtrA
MAVRSTVEGHTVTTLELFFDLVFVFAITQVTALVAADVGPQSMVRGLVLLALLWFSWCSYAWLGNQAHADEGIVRAAMLAAMAGMFVVALAIPHAWSDDGRTAILLASALAVVRLGHLMVYAVAALGDTALRGQISRTAVPVTIAVVLLVLGAVLGGSAQTALWALALVIDYGGMYTSGDNWRLPSAHHFAERHGLIIIIALGESIVAIGVGVASLPLTGPVVVAALLGLTVTIALWRTYFGSVAPLAGAALHASDGTDRIRRARDGYTYLHFPMVAGIIYLAVGLKKVTQYVADTGHHSLSDPLSTPALWCLYGGTALYLLAHVVFGLRNSCARLRPQAVVAVLLLAAPLLIGSLPALAALAVLAAVLVVLVGLRAIGTAPHPA